jgi:CheY-like chemotaxis protein
VPIVLLVEDNELNSDMLSRRLQRSGWEVILAVNGREGLEVAAARPIDLILMDMSLPDLDGWQATRLLKTNDQTRGIPVIALTAHAMSGDKEKALQAGCDEFESKPIAFAQLLEKMLGLLRKKGESS